MDLERFLIYYELALQNIPQNVLVVYHILRAYQFQENKSNNWAFAKTMFNQISTKLLKPHDRTDMTREKLINNVRIR